MGFSSEELAMADTPEDGTGTERAGGKAGFAISDPLPPHDLSLCRWALAGTVSKGSVKNNVGWQQVINPDASQR